MFRHSSRNRPLNDFDERVVGWFPRSAEVERDLVKIRPLIECP